MAQMRLDKFLGEMGLGTRSQVKELARKGRVAVNGQAVKKSDQKIWPGKDEVQVDGKTIPYVPWEYYLLNKPQGVVSATEDGRYPTVVDLIAEKKRKDLFPVGRLDKDTEGLLLITNDGQLAHRLLSPRRHVDKTYYARIRGRVTEEDVGSFAHGVNIGSGEAQEWTAPGVLEIIAGGEESEILLTIQEGKYHQVKRMFQAVGKEVVYLRRERMGALVLDKELKPGEYRPLTKKELENVKNEDA